MMQECRQCCGTGWQYCTVCQGHAQRIEWIYINRFAAHDKRVVSCWNCRGTGKENCEFCHGSGRVPKYDS